MKIKTITIIIAEEFKNPIGNKELAHKSCEAKKAKHNANKAAFFLEIGIINDFSSENSGNSNKNSLNKQYIAGILTPQYAKADLKITTSKEMEKEELKNTESTWSKKLSFGKDRPIFYFEAIKL